MVASSSDYKSFHLKWDRKSSVRVKPRGCLAQFSSDKKFFFPKSKQPLCAHPKIIALGEETTEYILLQTAYKILHEVSVVEVDGISNIATKIYNGKLDYKFSDEIRSDILAVIIDESYHAHIANDFIKQLIASTKIKPIKKDRETQFGITLRKSKKRLPNIFHNCLEIIAVCIGENTLTYDLIDMSKDKDVHPLFESIMMDHLSDEGRHQVLFREVLKEFWKNISDEQKEIVGPQIPEFIVDYFCKDLLIKYDKILLKGLPLSKDAIDSIIHDIYHSGESDKFSIKSSSITKNLIKLMEYAKVLDNKTTKKKFLEMGLI